MTTSQSPAGKTDESDRSLTGPIAKPSLIRHSATLRRSEEHRNERVRAFDQKITNRVRNGLTRQFSKSLKSRIVSVPSIAVLGLAVVALVPPSSASAATSQFHGVN